MRITRRKKNRVWATIYLLGFSVGGAGCYLMLCQDYGWRALAYSMMGCGCMVGAFVALIDFLFAE